MSGTYTWLSAFAWICPHVIEPILTIFTLVFVFDNLLLNRDKMCERTRPHFVDSTHHGERCSYQSLWKQGLQTKVPLCAMMGVIVDRNSKVIDFIMVSIDVD